MPVIRLEMDDDKEFACCTFCQAAHQQYMNTERAVAPVSSPYTKKLMAYHHLNCAKCGLYIEVHANAAENTVKEAKDVLFVCSNPNPCRHCLCQECGELYNVMAEQAQRQAATKAEAEAEADEEEEEELSAAIAVVDGTIKKVMSTCGGDATQQQSSDASNSADMQFEKTHFVC